MKSTLAKIEEKFIEYQKEHGYTEVNFLMVDYDTYKQLIAELNEISENPLDRRSSKAEYLSFLSLINRSVMVFACNRPDAEAYCAFGSAVVDEPIKL